MATVLPSFSLLKTIDIDNCYQCLITQMINRQELPVNVNCIFNHDLSQTFAELSYFSSRSTHRQFRLGIQNTNHVISFCCSQGHQSLKKDIFSAVTISSYQQHYHYKQMMMMMLMMITTKSMRSPYYESPTESKGV